MVEVWKVIKDHPNYSISNLGRVKTIKTGRILKPKITNGRYKQVGLYISNRICKWASIHRLVAEAFVESFDPNLYVDHIDKNAFNNNADNLRSVTPKENSNNRAPSIKTIEKIIELYKDGLTTTEIRTSLDWRQ